MSKAKAPRKRRAASSFKPESAAPSTNSSVLFLRPHVHAGKRYEEGDTLEASRRVCDKLVRLGSAKLLEAGSQAIEEEAEQDAGLDSSEGEQE